MTAISRILAGLCLALLSLALAAIFWVGVTEDGLRWALSELRARVPGTFDYDSIHGRLIEGVTVDGLVYRSSDVDFSADRVTFSWGPWQLFAGTLRIDSLKIDEAHLNIKTTGGPWPPVGFRLPIRLSLADATARNFRISAADLSAPVRLPSITLSGSAFGDRATFDRLKLSMPDFDIEARGTMGTLSPMTLDVDTSWRLNLGTQLPALSGSGQIGGDWNGLLLDQKLKAPWTASARGRIALDPVVRFKGTLESGGIALANIRRDWPALRFTGRSDIEGDLNGLTKITVGAETVPPAGELAAHGVVQWSPALAWNVSLKGNWDTNHIEGEAGSAPDHPLRIVVDAPALSLNDDEPLPPFKAEVVGRMKDHRLRLTTTHRLVTAALEATGGWSDAWRGQITTARVETGRLGALNLREPAALVVGAHAVSLAPLCLAAHRLSLCGDFSWTGTAPNGVRLEDGPVRGAVQVDIRDFTLVEQMQPALSGTTGHATAQFSLTGTARAPHLAGSLNARGFTSLPTLGLRIEDIHLEATGNQDGRFQITGGARSGGPLNFTGDADLSNLAAWSFRGRLDGSDIVLANTSAMQIQATPTLHIDANPERLNVEGDVLLPKVRLLLEHATNAVRASEDAIVLREAGTGAPDQPAEPSSALAADTQAPGLPRALSARINMSLGRDTRLEAFGYRGAPSGSIVITQQPRMPMTATGEIRLDRGRYRLYGRELEVEKGRIHWTGGDIDNPGIEARAIRRTGDVIAGARVSGTVSDLRIALFSEPAMSETDTLSWLLFGTSMSDLDKQNNALVLATAGILGEASGAPSILGEIGKAFNIEDVHLEAGEKENETRLMLGHQLSKKLYVNWGVSLVEGTPTYVMKLRLGNRFELEGTSGRDKSADILYRTGGPMGGSARQQLETTIGR